MEVKTKIIIMSNLKWSHRNQSKVVCGTYRTSLIAAKKLFYLAYLTKLSGNGVNPEFKVLTLKSPQG